MLGVGVAETVKLIIAVALGGALGAVGRYLISAQVALWFSSNIPWSTLLVNVLGSFILGAIGFVVGLWADKFDNMASATNFIIVPLSFLSGTFYSVERLPDVLKNVSEMNPFFYIIDGFRYGFLGISDGSIKFGLFYLIILSCLSWFAAYILFKKGYKIKS